MSSKAELLKTIEDNLRKESMPLKETATNLVFGEGNPESKVVFIGEAPGFHEDRLGRPFVGVAGRLLEKLLNSIGLKREDVYITNMVKYRPPENRDPLPSELDSFGPYLDQQLEIINPEVIVTLGRFSMTKFLPGVKISQVHGKPTRKNNRIIMPLYHPAAALRNGAVLRELEKDFLTLPKVLENPEEVLVENDKSDPNQIGLF
jgi:uracil-DNA glycosylase family 4